MVSWPKRCHYVMHHLYHLPLFSPFYAEEELNSIIGIEFNPNRVGFHTDTSANAAANDGFDLYTTGVLNVGVKVRL